MIINREVDEYTIQDFKRRCYIRDKEIVRMESIGYDETIFELEDGSKFLYLANGCMIRPIGNTGSEYVTSDMWKKEFSRKLRSMLIYRHINQKDLADAIGISEHTLSRYMNGKSIPDGYIIQRIEHHLELPTGYLTNFDYLL